MVIRHDHVGHRVKITVEEWALRLKTAVSAAALLAAATTVATGGTASAAQEGTVHPFSASKCSSTWCVEVYGTKLHVDYEVVSRSNSEPINGYVFAEDDHDRYYKWSGRTSQAYYTLQVNRSFSEGSLFCGAGSTSVANYANEICFTIHS